MLRPAGMALKDITVDVNTCDLLLRRPVAGLFALSRIRAGRSARPQGPIVQAGNAQRRLAEYDAGGVMLKLSENSPAPIGSKGRAEG